MRLHIFVSGKVQGVFFRKFVAETANEIGITGWCRNTKDGKVEIVAEGNNIQFLPFIQKLKEGSDAAQVSDIVVEEEQETGEFEFFEIKKSF